MSAAMARNGQKSKYSARSEKSTTWTHPMTLRLIELYRQSEHMWNRQSPFFRSIELRNKTFQQMSNELNVSTQEIMKKIQSLRKIYKSYWRAAQANETSVKWKYFTNLKFIENSFNANQSDNPEKPKKIRKRRPTSKKQQSIPTPATENSMLNEVSGSSIFFGFSPTNNRAEIANESSTFHQNDDDDDRNDTDCSVYISCSKRPKTENDVLLVTPTSTSVQYIQQIQSNNDRIDGFFKSIAETVKTFPPRILAEIKLNISTMIGQIELQLATANDVEYSHQLNK